VGLFNKKASLCEGASWRVAGAVMAGLLVVATSVGRPTVALASTENLSTHSAASAGVSFRIRDLIPKQVVANAVMVNGIPMVTGYSFSKWPAIVSKAAVVMDMNTGVVVYAKAPLARHYPASITKIMTALLALQHGRLSQQLTASALAVYQPADKLYQLVGEKHSLGILLKAMLVDSDNDVAVEIAQNLAGNVPNFVEWMNRAANALGATHTHFANPSGLQQTDHYTTAYDMALIARAAMQVPEFRKMVRTKRMEWHGLAWHALLVNLNPFLFNYSGAVGVKTGYTNEAKETLVVAAKRDHQEFLAVLMDCPLNAQIQQDATNLMNYAFAHDATQTLLTKGQTVASETSPLGVKIPLIATESVVATVPLGEHLQVLAKQVDAAPRNWPEPAGGPAGHAELMLSGPPSNPLSVPLAYASAWEVPTKKPAHALVGRLAGYLLLAALLALTEYVRRSGRNRARQRRGTRL
jgi:D-alanyl-D-alanine carboxypeptidase (penicillin-binding protein 5/6)